MTVIHCRGSIRPCFWCCQRVAVICQASGGDSVTVNLALDKYRRVFFDVVGWSEVLSQKKKDNRITEMTGSLGKHISSQNRFESMTFPFPNVGYVIVGKICSHSSHFPMRKSARQLGKLFLFSRIYEDVLGEGTRSNPQRYSKGWLDHWGEDWGDQPWAKPTNISPNSGSLDLPPSLVGSLFGLVWHKWIWQLVKEACDRKASSNNWKIAYSSSTPAWHHGLKLFKH